MRNMVVTRYFPYQSNRRSQFDRVSCYLSVILVITQFLVNSGLAKCGRLLTPWGFCTMCLITHVARASRLQVLKLTWKRMYPLYRINLQRTSNYIFSSSRSHNTLIEPALRYLAFFRRSMLIRLMLTKDKPVYAKWDNNVFYFCCWCSYWLAEYHRLLFGLH